MPVEAKPLFRPEVIRTHLPGVRLPEGAKATVAKWATMFASGRSRGSVASKNLVPGCSEGRG